MWASNGTPNCLTFICVHFDANWSDMWTCIYVYNVYFTQRKLKRMSTFDTKDNECFYCTRIKILVCAKCPPTPFSKWSVKCDVCILKYRVTDAYSLHNLSINENQSDLRLSWVTFRVNFLNANTKLVSFFFIKPHNPNIYLALHRRYQFSFRILFCHLL